jgi:outer membrane protein assembly factor BamA
LQFQIDNNPDANETLYDYRIYFISDIKKSKGNKREVGSVIKDVTKLKNEQEYESFLRNTIGSSIFILFPLNSFLQYGPEISVSYQDVNANDKMSKMFMKESGKYFIFQLGHQLKFHELDNFRAPRNGYMVTIKNALFINNCIKGNFPIANSMRSSISLQTYKSFNKNKSVYNQNIFEFGFINRFNSKKQIRILDKFFVSDTSIKGMHPVDGCGPKNLYGRNAESVGGIKYISASFNMHLPFSKKLSKSGLNWFVFTDVLSIFDTDIPNRTRKIIQDTIKFNAIAGLGISLSFGMGKLMMYFSYPLYMQKKDTPMYFGFSMS